MSDFNMLLIFLSASAYGAPIFALANRHGHAKIPARQSSSFGWAGRFDGNVIGGMLFGLGMGLVGACPGTVLVQVAAGVQNSRLLLASGALAGIVYVRWNRSHRKEPATGQHSLPEATGSSLRTILLSYEAALLALIATAGMFAPRTQSFVHPVVGGILIGLAQMASVYFAKKPLGASAAYEDVGNMFWGKKDLGLQNIIFAASIVAGARLTMQALPETAVAFAQSSDRSVLATIVGGFALIFGARMAGGCTSGHGISGLATFGASSFVTVPFMFAGGILAAMLSR
jgi:uncharacterized membrane protein YedE/YeeE